MKGRKKMKGKERKRKMTKIEKWKISAV